MKIIVAGMDGLLESITLSGNFRVVDGLHQNSIVDESGVEHFFDQDGYYDGFGAAVEMTTAEAAEILDALREGEENRHDRRH